MSPVQPSSGHATRALLLAFAAVIVAVGGLWLASVFITNRHNGQVHDGEVGGVVTLGKASQLANRISSAHQPVYLPDTSGNHLRNLYLQHVGTRTSTGWVVFAAQVPNESDGCVWKWQPDEQLFRASCDQAKTLPANAAGVAHYPVAVKDGKVKVDLRVTPGEPPSSGVTTG